MRIIKVYPQSDGRLVAVSGDISHYTPCYAHWSDADNRCRAVTALINEAQLFGHAILGELTNEYATYALCDVVGAHVHAFQAPEEEEQNENTTATRKQYSPQSRIP
jgi:hypothetical protein